MSDLSPRGIPAIKILEGFQFRYGAQDINWDSVIVRVLPLVREASREYLRAVDHCCLDLDDRRLVIVWRDLNCSVPLVIDLDEDEIVAWIRKGASS